MTCYLLSYTNPVYEELPLGALKAQRLVAAPEYFQIANQVQISRGVFDFSAPWIFEFN